MGYTFFAGPQLQHTYEKAPDVDQPALTHEFAVCVVGHDSGRAIKRGLRQQIDRHDRRDLSILHIGMNWIE